MAATLASAMVTAGNVISAWKATGFGGADAAPAAQASSSAGQPLGFFQDKWWVVVKPADVYAYSGKPDEVFSPQLTG